MGVGWGSQAERWSYQRNGKERHERMGADGPSLGETLLFTEGVPLEVFGGLRTGVPPTAGKGGDRQWGDHPTQELLPPTPPPPHSLRWQQLLPLAGGVGRRVPVTTSPRLELELSPDLLCGQRGKRSCERRGGREGGGTLFSHVLPAPHSPGDPPAPLAMPEAALCAQGTGSTLEALSQLDGLSAVPS